MWRVPTRETVVVSRPTNSDLNRLFAASLEFGENWRRPIPDLAATYLTHLSKDEQAAVSDVIERCRHDVEAQIEKIHLEAVGAWSKSAVLEVERWITDRFPWMSAGNRRHAISQGQYYAWHS